MELRPVLELIAAENVQLDIFMEVMYYFQDIFFAPLLTDIWPYELPFIGRLEQFRWVEAL